jgi:hypothetical protein
MPEPTAENERDQALNSEEAISFSFPTSNEAAQGSSRDVRDDRGVVHIAGPEIQVGPYVRQRCGWCGAVLGDYDLGTIMVPVGQDPRPPKWPNGGLVAIDGSATWTVPYEDGAQLPANACAQLDPAVTA